MNSFELLLEYIKASGLSPKNTVKSEFYLMYLQLDYLYRAYNDKGFKTEVAKELHTCIKSNSFSYSQFLDINIIRLVYYILVNKVYVTEDISSAINLYKFKPYKDTNYFNSLLGFITNNITNEVKAGIFDTSTYVSLEVDSDSKELNCSDDVKSFINEMVKELADDIVKIQSSLYEAGYDGVVPDGVLWKVGQLAVEPNVDLVNGTSARYKFIQHSNPTLLKLYQYINKVTNNTFSLANYHGNMKVSLSNIDKGCYYYPHFQVRNSCGLMGLDNSLDKWLSKNKKEKISSVKELKSYIIEEVTNEIMKSLSDKQDSLGLSKVEDVSYLLNNRHIISIFDKFRKAFTTCALISESKKDVVLKLRVCTGDKNIANILSRESLEVAINNGIICNKYTKISKWDLDTSGRVLTVTFMIDSKRYNSFPLFAANILESVKKSGGPSWSKVTIGRDYKDKMFTLNLNSNLNRVLAIIAGSRSGKGVLTLKIESDARALGIPVFYLDYKPDMAKTYYDMARSFSKETFAFDGFSLSAELGRDFDVLYDYGSIPEEIRTAIAGGDTSSDNAIFNNKEFAYFTSYVRGVQVICKLIELRAKAYKNGGMADGYSISQLGGDRILVVLDEVEKMAIYADNLVRKGGKLDFIRDRVKESLLIAGTPKSQVDTHPCMTWFTSYKNWVDDIFSLLETYDKAEIALAKANIVILAQSVNIDETWGVVGKHLGTMIVNGIKFCGNGSATGKGSRKYGSSNCDSEWTNELPNRYFIIQREGGGSIYPSNSSLVKTYFLLNEVYNPDGSESNCVKELMNNLGEDAEAVRSEITTEDGKLNPALGYYGYIKELTGMDNEALANTFQVSFDIGELVAKHIGYNSLLECMYNLHILSSGNKVYEEYNEANSIVGQIDINSSPTVSVKSDLDFDLGIDNNYNDTNISYDEPKNSLDIGYSQSNTNYNLDNKDFSSTLDFDLDEDDLETNDVYRDNTQNFYREPEKVSNRVNNSNNAFSLDKNNRVVVDKSNVSSYYGLNSNNSIDCRGISHSRVFKNAFKLAKSPKGAMVFKRDASKFIFDIISSNIGLSNISKISLINENMIVNNKIIDLNGIVGGDTNRRLSDILSFKEFIRVFKGISYLEMNGNFIDNFILEFNLDVSSKEILSVLFSSLNLLNEVKLGDNSVSRTKFTLENRKLDNYIKENRQRNSLDSMFNKLSRNGKSNELNSNFSSNSKSSSKYEKSTNNRKIIGRVTDTIGISVYRAFSFVDWLANGGRR